MGNREPGVKRLEVDGDADGLIRIDYGPVWLICDDEEAEQLRAGLERVLGENHEAKADSPLWTNPASRNEPFAHLETPENLDELLARMQSSEARSGAESLFSASPAELGDAALNAAKDRGAAREPTLTLTLTREEHGEPECPGPECLMCSEEYCARHFSDPCECDCIERHEGGDKATPESEREPTLTREEMAELRTRHNTRFVAPGAGPSLTWDVFDALLAMAERCAEAEDERDDAWDDLIYQRTTVAEEIEQLREQYANAGHGLSAEKYLRYRAATALEERDVARNERDEARATLRKYGRHTDDCAELGVVEEDTYGPCDCGLSAARGDNKEADHG